MRRTKRAIAAATIALGVASASGMLAFGSRASAQTAGADAPTVPSLASLMERDLHFGMTHAEVTDAYNKTSGLFDREYAPQITRLQPGIQQQQLEADRENRKANFARSFTQFLHDPTGYDITPLHAEYSYNNGEALQKVFKDGKNRYFFFIKDKFWKLYDEIPLRDGGLLGSTFQEALVKLSGMLGVPGRLRSAGQATGLTSPEADWQDGTTHLRAVDRSGEHLVGLVLEDKNTVRNLSVLRTNKPADPFAVDPAIAAITSKGVSDPNAARGAHAADGGAPRRR
jgi:hypothetical protein